MGTFMDPFNKFHAGRFLRECLEESGFDEKWLANKTYCDVAALEEIFAMSNMDAELFVGIGRHMGAAFFDRVHEMIFNKKPQEEPMEVA
jgi:hypothetical protein